MSWLENLNRKIKEKTVTIGIVGLGYVGLPLAIAFSKKFNVIGYNIDQEKNKLLMEKKSYIEDVRDEEINLKKLFPTSDYKNLIHADVIIITVPTPLKKDKTPDLSFIKSSAESIGKILKKGHLVILKSTTFPGTTEEYLVPILEKMSGLEVIDDFGVAYSPERVDPGNKYFDIKNTPNVVGGLTEEMTNTCKILYEEITSEVIGVKDCKTAEAVKMVENIFRNVNIALVNEIALIFQKMNIDTWEVIDAAKSKPFGFMPFYPGPGVGGHCIPLDPYYLSYRAKQFGIIPRFIETAGEINDFMPIHVINLAKKEIRKLKLNLRDSKVLIIGLAYKPNISDTRESPAIKIIEELKEMDVNIKVYDPISKCVNTRFGFFKSTDDLIKNLKWADCIIIVTNHDKINLDDNLKKIKEHEKVIIDTRNSINLDKHAFGKLIYKRL